MATIWRQTATPSLQRIEMAAAATPAPGKFIFSCFFFGSADNFFLQLDYMRMNYHGDNEHTPQPKITMNSHVIR